MNNHLRYDFTGTSVLVTGGTSGIGHAIAKEFLAAGATVHVTGTRLDPTSYEMDLDAFTYHCLQLGERDSIDALIAAVREQVQALDVLVNNAGSNFPDGRSEWIPDAFATAIERNLVGPMRLTVGLESLLADSAASGGASVVNLASMAAFRAVPIVPGYGAAKAGIVNLTGALAKEWANKGVRVNAIAPGIIKTPMTEPMLGIPDLIDPELARTPMGRLGTPQEVAMAALFLSSSAASYITGHTLAVDGGYLLG